MVAVSNAMLLTNPPYSTSDHMPVVAEVVTPKKKTKVKVATWNIMKRCASGPRYPNNPYYLEEEQLEYQNNRLQLQINHIKKEFIDKGVDFILLQEADILSAGSDYAMGVILQLKNWGYNILTDDLIDPPTSKKGLAILYKNNHHLNNSVKELRYDVPTRLGTLKKSDQITAVFDINGEQDNQIAVGNFHLNYNNAKAQVDEQARFSHTKYVSQGIPFIAAGDANAPTKNTGLISIDGATCHDSVVKETKDIKLTTDKFVQGIHHAGIRTNPLKDYDSFYAAGLDSITILAGCKVEVDPKDSQAVVYPKHRGKTISYTTTKPDPKPTAPTGAALENKAIELAKIEIAKIISKHSANTEIEKAFEASLDSQNELIKPKKAYRGIGMKSVLRKMENGQFAIEIIDVFAKDDFKRFSSRGNAFNSAADAKNIEGKFITSVTAKDGSMTSINDIVARYGNNLENVALQKELASIFHTKKPNLEFEISDSNGENTRQINCLINNTAYVTADCAQAALAGGASGEKFDVNKHDLNCLNQSSYIINEAKKIVTQQHIK